MTTNKEYLTNLKYELQNLHTVMSMVTKGETAEEKLMYLLGRRDAVSYFLSAIIDGIEWELEQREKEMNEWQHSMKSTQTSSELNEDW